MKCKYHKKCKLYQESSETCNKNSGMYYGSSRPAGCYRNLEKINNERNNN